MPDIDSKTSEAEPTWVGEVIHFWLEELTEARWYAKNDYIDSVIRDRFFSLHEQLATQDGLDVTEPRTILAAVIVLDQFSRNLFRGDPRAYAVDSIARRLARAAIEQGFDIPMTKQERLFLYHPFEHSENCEDQAFALRLITQLDNEDWTQYAMAHKVIIDRFGRFPHRNAVLNRPSTADELEFLIDPTNSF
jgi:uncharacterized protein (DUF924 family)